MQRLPVELHARIFAGCLSQEPYVKPAPNEAPLLLLQVCRGWRDVVLRTPELWSSLDTISNVDFDIYALEAARSADVDFCETWLSRAGNRPLSLALALGENSFFADELAEVAFSYRHRFERLRIVAQSELDVEMLPEGSSLLKHLAIEARYEEGERNLTVVQPYPNLHTLLLDSLLATPATLSQPSWATLVRLGVRLPEGTVYEADVLLTLLDHCPRLERLIFGPISSTGPPLRSRSYPTLRAVSIVLDSFDAEENPHPVLVLPSVAFLEILLDFEWPLEHALMNHGGYKVATVRDPASARAAERTCSLRLRGGGEFLAIFDPCWANVTHLDLEVTSGIDMWREILTGCPNLQKLSVAGSPCTMRSASLCDPLTHDRLESLSIVTEVELGNLLGIATFPALRELTIRAAYYGEPEDILDFLARSKCPLELLWVSRGLSNAWTAEEMAELRRLVPSLDPQNLS